MEVKCTFTEMVDLDLLVPNPRNANKHPEEQIKLLAKIMKHQGWRRPIVVSKRSGFVVAGHGRLMAAKLNGWTSAPVDRQDYASEADEYSDMIADNKIAELAETDMAMVNLDAASFPDLDLDLLGIPDFSLIDQEVLEPGCDEDEVPEHVEPRTKLGDIYRLGNHRLMCGDSTSSDDFVKLMNGEIAELCFTSPPYADQREYNGGKELSTEHLATFIRTAFSSCRYFAVNLGYSRKSGEVNSYWDDYIKEAQGCGLKLLSWNIWDRSGLGVSIGNQTAFFPIWHEWIFVFGCEPKELNRTKPNKSAGSKSGTNRQADGSLKKGGGVTAEFGKIGTVIKCGVADGKLHPAMFPVELPEQYLDAMTAPGDVIYEPFGGAGTTLIAAEKSSRIAHLMELDPKYCDVIVARWEKFTGKKAELLNG
jgi:DNA modification methylase